MKNWIRGIVAVFSILALTGCATSFSSGNLETVERFPEVKSRKSAYIDLAFSGKLNGEPWKQNDAENTEYLKRKCVSRFEESGLFGVVSTEDKSMDLNLYVAIINEKTHHSTAQTFAALTLFIYPYRASDSFRMLALVKEPATGKFKRIQMETTVSHWQSLFLLPLSPFNRPGNRLTAATDRLFDHLILEIHQSGLLD